MHFLFSPCHLMQKQHQTALSSLRVQPGEPVCHEWAQPLSHCSRSLASRPESELCA